MSAQPALAAAPAHAALRLGFLGLGWIGRARLDALTGLPGVAIAALAEPDEQRLAAAAALHPRAHAVRDLGELLDCDLDGVVIATPNAQHASQAIACLERGLPVFCQKPLAVNSVETRAVLAAARAADRLLAVDFSYRRVAGMSELRERIAAGELGELLALDLVFHNAYGPDKAWARDRSLAGGGALLDLGVHLIDLALWLQPHALQLAQGRAFANGRRLSAGAASLEDLALAELTTAEGAVVRIACSWNAHVGCDAVIGFDLLGTKGGAAWRNVDGSFYDFTLDVFRGRTRERLASGPDAWGGRALQGWIEQVRADPRFDVGEARLIEAGAHLIDEIYAA